MRRFTDQYRDRFGVEPICRVLQIAPSGYRRYAAQQRNPTLRGARAQRDAVLLLEIQRIWQAHLQVYGADKVWKQMNREGILVARCTVERLMRHLGIQGVVRGKRIRTTIRGSQYVSIRYTERLAEAGIEPSVGSKGDSYDNALAETINGLYKAELIHRRAPWKTKASLELATLEWVHWFNHHRLLEPLGYIPPAEAEAQYYQQLERQAGQAA